MSRRTSRLATAAVVGLALAGPALAQEAQPTSRPAEQAARVVAPRDLMTPDERAAFRAEMQAATPEQRQALWERKHAELGQRASARGVTMAEPGRGPGMAERGSRREAGSEGSGFGSRLRRMFNWGPRGV